MTPVILPDWVERELKTAPHNIGKRGLAELITRLFHPISYRTVEERPLVWRRSNNYAVTPTRPAIEAEYQLFINSREYRGGKRSARSKPGTAEPEDTTFADNTLK